MDIYILHSSSVAKEKWLKVFSGGESMPPWIHPWSIHMNNKIWTNF